MGAGALESLPAELDARGIRHAFLVTDRNLTAFGNLPKKVQNILGNRCAGVYDGVTIEPTLEHVQEGLGLARNAAIDSIVSVGGGSVMDCAKGIAACLRARATLKPGGASYFLEGPAPPHFAVPTTAGSGSEVSAAALIFDANHEKKALYFDPYMGPRMAILDAKLTLSLSPTLTASTGLDALCHAVEALCSTLATPMSNALAHNAVGTILENLSTVFNNAQNIHARQAMLVAASMAGAAFINSGLGVVHALAHALGALKGIPHGMACTVFLSHSLRFNIAHEPARCAGVAHAMGIDTAHLGVHMACEAASAALDRLLEKLELPAAIRNLGINREDFRAIAELAVADACLRTNPRTVLRAEELLPLLEAAY
jgi:alcohol dehydrogenase